MNSSTSAFVIAAIVYAVIASYISNVQTVAALSILLILGALIINKNNGANFLSDLGIAT